MKKFLFNFKTKPSLFTLFIIIGFLCCLGGAFWYFNSEAGNRAGYFGGVVLFYFLVVGISLIPTFILYRYIIKHFKTKHVFITESVLIVLFVLYHFIPYLISNRHLVIDLTNYSENYFLIVQGEDGEQKKTDTRPSTFFYNEEAVLHENYFVLEDKPEAGLSYLDEIIYPKSWKVTEEDSSKQVYSRGLQFDPFSVTIYYNEDFNFSSRALDSLATLVVYARQHDISVSQAKKELANVWAEMNYIYTTPLEPYVKNSKAYLHYVADPNEDYEAYEKSYKEWEIQIVITPPSDNGIYLSYTSYERIIDDLKRRAEHHNWSEKTMNELTEYYSTRMPFGYYRLFIERPTEEQADSYSFSFEGGYLPSNRAQSPQGSSSTNWTNTMIFRKYGKPDSTFQVTIDELITDAGKDSFSFDMKTN